MPVLRLCPHCKRGFLKSTYQMLEHVTKCNPNGHSVTVYSGKNKMKILQTEGVKNDQIYNLEKISKKELSSFSLT